MKNPLRNSGKTRKNAKKNQKNQQQKLKKKFRTIQKYYCKTIVKIL